LNDTFKGQLDLEHQINQIVADHIANARIPTAA
jgi:hypothetical protein